MGWAEAGGGGGEGGTGGGGGVREERRTDGRREGGREGRGYLGTAGLNFPHTLRSVLFAGRPTQHSVAAARRVQCCTSVCWMPKRRHKRSDKGTVQCCIASVLLLCLVQFGPV